MRQRTSADFWSLLLIATFSTAAALAVCLYATGILPGFDGLVCHSMGSDSLSQDHSSQPRGDSASHSFPMPEAVTQETSGQAGVDLSDWKPVLSTGVGGGGFVEKTSRRRRRPGPSAPATSERTFRVLFCSWLI